MDYNPNLGKNTNKEPLLIWVYKSKNKQALNLLLQNKYLDLNVEDKYYQNTQSYVVQEDDAMYFQTVHE